jgi:hypothetical protein
MATNSTFQLKRQLPADVDSSSSVDQFRIFLNQATGLLSMKDFFGVVTVIGGLQNVNFTHNAVIGFAQSPYAAGQRETVKVDPSAGLVVVRLPTAIGNAGSQVQVVSKSPLPGPPPNQIQVQGILGQLINGVANFFLTTAEESFVVESDGANWLIL